MSVAETQNTTCTVYRSTTVNQFGDVIDNNVPFLEHLPATLIETGKSVQDPSTPTPRTIRQIQCWVPEWAGVLNTDRILDERTGDVYIIIGVTKPPTIIGVPVDTRLDLKRVSANSA
jgi:hypothetical protein